MSRAGVRRDLVAALEDVLSFTDEKWDVLPRAVIDSEAWWPPAVVIQAMQNTVEKSTLAGGVLYVVEAAFIVATVDDDLNDDTLDDLADPEGPLTALTEKESTHWEDLAIDSIRDDDLILLGADRLYRGCVATLRILT